MLAKKIDWVEEKSETITRPKTGLFAWLAPCLLLVLAGFICFYNLDEQTIHAKDEFIHSSAAQSLWQRGVLWDPYVLGRPYPNKPPLKMLATYLPLSIFGESNIAYRFWDACFGVFLTLLAYFAARRFFASIFAGLWAGLAILACNSLVFFHGFRFCSQDSGMVLFVSLQILLSYFALTGQRRFSLAVAAAACGVVAVLVKSFGGLLGLMTIGVWHLLVHGFWKPRAYFTRLKSDLTRLCLIYCPPVVALLAHFYYLHERGEGRLGVALGFELVERLEKGYHNAGELFFYTKTIFLDQYALPPEIFVFALFFGLWKCLRDRRAVSHFFTMVWALFPLSFFACLSSRQVWYINPVLVPVSILTGGFFVELQRRVLPLWSGGKIQRSGRALALVVANLFLVGHLLFYVGRNAWAVIHEEPKLSFDVAAREINRFRLSHKRTAVMIDRRVRIDRQQRLYVAMAQTKRQERLAFSEGDEIQRRMRERKFGIVMAGSQLAHELFSKSPPNLLLYVPQTLPEPFWVMVYQPKFVSSVMLPPQFELKFEALNDRFELAVPATSGIWRSAGQISLNAAEPLSQSDLAGLEVLLNGKSMNWQVVGEQRQQVTFAYAAGDFREAGNELLFRCKGRSGCAAGITHVQASLRGLR